jgi:hypothetical protein
MQMQRKIQLSATFSSLLYHIYLCCTTYISARMIKFTDAQNVS